MAFKKTYEDLNMFLPFSPNAKVQQIQREKMAIMSFLAGLPAEFESTKSQILFSLEISSLQISLIEFFAQKVLLHLFFRLVVLWWVEIIIITLWDQLIRIETKVLAHKNLNLEH